DREPQSIGVGQANVLRRHGDRSPKKRHGIFATLEHPSHPVQRTLWIASSERLVIRGEHVEMLLATLVVYRDPAGEGLCHGLTGDGPPRSGLLSSQLQRGQGPARVT